MEDVGVAVRHLNDSRQYKYCEVCSRLYMNYWDRPSIRDVSENIVMFFLYRLDKRG